MGIYKATFVSFGVKDDLERGIIMDKYGVKSTYDAIRNRLLDYINTEYLGKNDA